MSEMTSYKPGTPSWVDLMTSDPQAAREFYGPLLGWDFEFGSPETGHYTMCTLRGRNVAGMLGEPAQEGMPTAWTTYMATDDVDAASARITDSGGQVMMGPIDVMQEGRMLVAADPTGAVFGLWQAGNHSGASLVNEPGSVSWNELATRDLDRAQTFYTDVFGCDWTDIDTRERGPPYRTFAVDGRDVGGAMQMTADWPQDIPPHWMTYFQVADVDATVDKATELGGGGSVPAMDSPFGRFAVLRDPQGGVFTAISSVTPAS